MDQKRIVFLVNPISGTTAKARVVDHIHLRIDRSRYTYEIRYTERAGHATELAAQAVREGFDIVVAVGGDGTVNEVARSLIGTSTALAVIPCGSGNGLARHLQLPLSAPAAIEVINQGLVHHLDYGLINDRPFFCTCGVGFDAFLSLKFAESKHRGLKSYVEKTLTDGLRYKPDTYLIEDETGSKQYRAFLIACANASQYGNNAFIAPTASMKDGLLDVIIIEPFSKLEAPSIVLQLFGKTLSSNSHVKTFRSRRLRIVRETEGPAHSDGDAFTTGREINVEVVPGQLAVVVNPRADALEHTPLRELADYFSSWSSPKEGFRRTLAEIQRTNTAIKEHIRKL